MTLIAGGSRRHFQPRLPIKVRTSKTSPQISVMTRHRGATALEKERIACAGPMKGTIEIDRVIARNPFFLLHGGRD